MPVCDHLLLESRPTHAYAAGSMTLPRFLFLPCLFKIDRPEHRAFGRPERLEVFTSVYIFHLHDALSSKFSQGRLWQGTTRSVTRNVR
jgi:hypothetical protein